MKGRCFVKKILSLVLSLVLLLAVMPMGAVYADSTATIKVAELDGIVGETVTVDVSLANNPGIISMRLDTAYDDSALELVGATGGSGFSGMAFGPTQNNPFVSNWIDSIHPDNTNNGAFITLTFKIKDDAKDGFYPITVAYSQSNVFDEDYNDVFFAIENGGVHVSHCNHANKTNIQENVTILTCTQDASYDRVSYCNDCGAEVAREKFVTNYATGHNFGADDICTVCGSYKFTEPTIYVKNAEGVLGDTIDVDICLVNNPGIISTKLKIAYDDNSLELVGKNAGSAFSGMAFGRDDANPFIVNWVDSIHPNNTNDGVFVTLTFKIKDGAAEGFSPITVSYDGSDVFNEEYNDVVFDVENGGVEIKHCQHLNKRTVQENVTTLTCTQNAGYDLVTYCNDCDAEISRNVIVTERATGHKFDADNVCLVCGAERFTGPTVYVDGVTGLAGDEINVVISLANNPGIVSMKLSVSYDASVLELVNKTGAGVYASSMSFGPTTKNPFVVNWVDTRNDNFTDNGAFAILTFKIKDDAALGDTPITITYDADDVYDIDYDNVAFNIENGVVTVIDCTHDNTETKVENEIDATCEEVGRYDEVVYCVDCGVEVSRVTLIVDALRHDYRITIENNVEPTCTTDGGYVEVHTCGNCGDVYTNLVEIPALGHEIEFLFEQNYIEPTCTEDGSYDDIDLCIRCEEPLKINHKIIPALGHLEGEITIENVVDPTCTEDGSYDEVVYCERFECKAELSRNTIIVDALGHTPGETVIENETEANCTTKKSYDEVVYCDVCDKELSRETFTGGYGHILDAKGNCSVCKKMIGKPMFFVTSGKVVKGKTFTVDVVIKNNPGIVSTKLNIGYDEDLIELLSYENVLFDTTAYGPVDSEPFVVNWIDTVHPNNTQDGTIVRLTFQTKEDIDVDMIEITVSYDQEDVFDSEFDSVVFETNSGFITVIDVEIGDVNGDGKINNKDLGLLMQYLNSWDVELYLDAADVNGDGKVNNKDLGLLMQYLNSWDVELG